MSPRETTALTNVQGEVTDTYLYDAYGNLLNSTGTTVNPYRYAGEQYDPVLAHYYLRARYYDPSTGRFTSRDPFEGVMREPLSLAKYPYAHGNPVNLTDPSGLFVSSSGVSASLAITTILASIQVASYLPLVTLEPEFPQEAIDENEELRNIARTPISIRDNQRRVVAAREIERANLLNYRPNLRGFPYVIWGTEYQDVFQHDYDALRGNGSTKNPPGRSPAFLLRIPQPGWGRRWLDNVLASDSSLGDRDEYPYNITAQGGPIFYERNAVSVRYVNLSRNRKQGNRLKNFFRWAQVSERDPIDGWFGVLALPDSFNSYWVGREKFRFNRFTPV